MENHFSLRLYSFGTFIFQIFDFLLFGSWITFYGLFENVTILQLICLTLFSLFSFTFAIHLDDCISLVAYHCLSIFLSCVVAILHLSYRRCLIFIGLNFDWLMRMTINRCFICVQHGIQEWKSFWNHQFSLMA